MRKGVKKANDTWIIKTKDNVYFSSYVVIASGTVNDCPNIPTDQFYKNFSGEIYHSESFDKIKNVEGKNILIVGGSDTGVDCAIELKNKNNVTVSIKNGVWFQNRNLGAYEAADSLYNRFLDIIIKNILSKKYVDDNIKKDNSGFVQLWWGDSGSGIDLWKSKCNYLHP